VIGQYGFKALAVQSIAFINTITLPAGGSPCDIDLSSSIQTITSTPA